MKKITTVLITLILTASIGTTVFAAGWATDGYGWWYQNDNGTYPSGCWQVIDGDWYHFDDYGYMQTGWIYDGGWYYLSGSGAMATGWIYDNGTWYYMDGSGTMATGERIIDGVTYQFGSDGAWIEGNAGYNSGLVPPYELDNYYGFMMTMSDSEFLEAYDAAAVLVKPLVGLERSEQLYWITTYLRILFESGMTYSMSAPHYNDPYGYLILGSASCAGCAKATGLCLNILGIPYEHVNEGEYSHQWCRVYVNGEYWICDAYGLYVGPEPAPYIHPYLS